MANNRLSHIRHSPSETFLPMKRAQAFALLSASKPELMACFGVKQLALFGSTARDDARPVSDVDVLVDFDGPASSARYFGVQSHLEDLLGTSVDLVTSKTLRSELRSVVEREALHV